MNIGGLLRIFVHCALPSRCHCYFERLLCAVVFKERNNCVIIHEVALSTMIYHSTLEWRTDLFGAYY